MCVMLDVHPDGAATEAFTIVTADIWAPRCCRALALGQALIGPDGLFPSSKLSEVKSFLLQRLVAVQQGHRLLAPASGVH